LDDGTGVLGLLGGEGELGVLLCGGDCRGSHGCCCCCCW
jgi:hypothetical protein